MLRQIRPLFFKNPISFRARPYNRSFYYRINIRICLFFILMKLWLHYLTEPYRKSKIAENLVDAADAITSVPDFSPTGSAPNITGHGGEFGGGGASGAWTEAGGIAETASTVGETATEAAGEAVSGLAKAARSFRKSWAFCPSTNFVNVSAGIRFNFNLYIYGADRIPA